MALISSVKNKRNIVIAVVIVVLIVIAIGVNSFLTGFTTYNEELEKELEDYRNEFILVNQSLNECVGNFDECMAGFDTCKTDIKTQEASLQECERQKKIASDYSVALQDVLNTCEAEKGSVQEDYNKLMNYYKNMIRDSVTSRCCSYDDIKSSKTKNWDIKDNEIVCSGNYTVNCGTGETNY